MPEHNALATEIDLYLIEVAARQAAFLHPLDTLRLVALARHLQAEVARLKAESTRLGTRLNSKRKTGGGQWDS